MHIKNVASRSRSFYKSTEPGHFLVDTTFPIRTPKVPLLFSFDIYSQFEDYLNLQLEKMKPVLEAEQDLDDDTIPSICPGFC